MYWVKKFVHFHELKHPRDMGQVEVGYRVALDGRSGAPGAQKTHPRGIDAHGGAGCVE